MTLLNMMVNMQAQTNDLIRQGLELQRQALELAREHAKLMNDQRTRQIQELEKWQNGHEDVIDSCKRALGQLEQVHVSLMREIADYVDENHEMLVEGDFSLSDFVDRFGPRLAHLNTMLAVLRPLAAAQKKNVTENPSAE